MSKKFPKNINVPISEEMDKEIKQIVEKLRGISPGINKTDWARVRLLEAIKRDKQKRNPKLMMVG